MNNLFRLLLCVLLLVSAGCTTLTPAGDTIQQQRERLAQYEGYLAAAILAVDFYEDWQTQRGTLTDEQQADLEAARSALRYWRDRVAAMRAALDYEPLPESNAATLKALNHADK